MRNGQFGDERRIGTSKVRASIESRGGQVARSARRSSVGPARSRTAVGTRIACRRHVGDDGAPVMTIMRVEERSAAMLEAVYASLVRVKNPHAVALGRLGGRKGGHAGGRARADALSPRRRRDIARAAARARWGHLPDRLRTLFPGYRFEDITLPEQVDLVMLHVLSQGGPEDKRWLARRLGDEAIRRWIIKHRGRGLTVRQMTPWVTERTAWRWQRANPAALLWEYR